ncbi:hypothetical protein [Ekhidna sp.]|uniref:hypothetical protein n=1 Tax=Ekhidna sp. TaxID=2608089 RepID=UPI003B5BD55E
MKKQQVAIIVIGIFALFAIFYFYNQEPEIEQHPTLSAAAKMPDYHLKNVAHYEEEERHEMSAFSLEKAIESIWKLEKDVDDESFQKLEESISRLEEVHRSIVKDSISSIDLRSTFEYALNNLAHAELEIAEMYAETNQMEKANIALRYAQLHIKNAMLFHSPYWGSDSVQLAIEKHVFEEMDSLLVNKAVSPVNFTMTVNKMIKEVDQIIEKE